MPAAPPIQQGGGDVVLNFEGADLREVVKNILGDILNESYTIDAAVGGQVTIRTSSGISRDALPATLETLLRMNGATMVKEGGLYKILPSAVAVRGNVTPQLGNSQRPLPPGFSVQIVPLRYIGMREMMRILEPFAKDATAVRPDDLRNLLILSGTERELRHLLETIEHVRRRLDRRHVGRALHAAELRREGGEGRSSTRSSATATRARSRAFCAIIPIERMNALLVDHAAARVPRGSEEMDRAARPGRRRRRAALLRLPPAEPARGKARTAAAAGVHRRVPQPAGAPAAPTVAPGTPAGTIVSPPTFQPQPTTPTPRRRSRSAAAAGPGGGGRRRRAAEGIGIVRNIQVVADKDNNTLLIVATAPEYTMIEAALKKLDVPSRQVVDRGHDRRR